MNSRKVAWLVVVCMIGRFVLSDGWQLRHQVDNAHACCFCQKACRKKYLFLCTSEDEVFPMVAGVAPENVHPNIPEPKNLPAEADPQALSEHFSDVPDSQGTYCDAKRVS